MDWQAHAPHIKCLEMNRPEHVAEPMSLDALVQDEGIRRLVDGAAGNLYRTWSEKRSLFPYSIRLLEDGSMHEDFEHRLAIRYTINSLVGLSRYERLVGAENRSRTRAWTSNFLERNEARIESLADWGLLTLLHAELGDVDGAASSLDRVRGASIGAANVLQDIAWALWGSCAAARLGVPAAETEAIRLAEALLGRYRHVETGMPLHTTARWRRRIVSFGALTYYLRALHEAARTLDREDAAQAFDRGLERALTVQRPDGGWPWLMDAATGLAVDEYPLFVVHQDSMAMLFLLPGLDTGHDHVLPAIRRSLAWTHGANALGIEMYADAPFFLAYRSIERSERFPRPRRFLRSTVRAVRRRGAGSDPADGSIRLNDECRSYHPGWILFAWADRLGP